MAKTRQHSLLEKQIETHRREIMESVGSGACKDHADYRDQCGYLRGLEDALKMMDNISEENQ